MSVDEQLKRIEFILCDVDGVLTDGGVLYDNQGIEIKKFHIRDGLGVRLWQKAGFKFGVLTARNSHIVKLRAAELNIEIVRQGFEDKLPAAKEVIAELGLSAEQVCHIGDDLTDLSVMRHVGVGIAVADAVEEVRDNATYVTKTPGGRGAVREAIEVVLKAKNRWEGLIRSYLA